MKGKMPGRYDVLVEMRTYTVYAGKMAEFLRLYESEGMAVQVPVLGKMVGYFTTDIGPLNQVIHMWGYESLEDRARRRAELASKPEWQTYLKKATPYFQNQETKILIPTAWSPIK